MSTHIIATRSAVAVAVAVALTSAAILPAVAAESRGELAPTSQITGRVTGPISEKTKVYAVNANQPVGSPIDDSFALSSAVRASVEADGRFTLEVPRGRYRVAVVGPTTGSEWFPDKSWGRDAAIVLATPATAAVVNMTTEAPGAIVGTVLAADGPVAGGSVYAYTTAGQFAGIGRLLADGTFDLNGTYGSLPVGGYKLQFRTEQGPGQWYGGSTDLAGAATVKLEAGKTAELTYTVLGDELYASSTASISGNARVGGRLSAKSAWSLPDAKLSHQWMRDGKAIRGATASTYKVTKSDKGHRISVKVTATHVANLPDSSTARSIKITR